MLQFTVHNAYSRPFPHFLGHGTFPDGATESLVDWLKTEAPWKLVETDFYEQFEFDLMTVELPAALRNLQDKSALSQLRGKVEDHFQVDLREEMDLTAHKLLGGQRIRLHNDFLVDGETHRLILQLNPNWEPDCGGYLMVFDGNDPRRVNKVIPPVQHSLFGFAIRSSSYHAVSAVNFGERLTLVYSFYENG